MAYKYGTKKQIEAVAEPYQRDRAAYDAKYIELNERMTAKVDAGLYRPTSDDQELESILDLRNSIYDLTLSKNPMGKLRDLDAELQNYIDCISLGRLQRIAL